MQLRLCSKQLQEEPCHTLNGNCMVLAVSIGRCEHTAQAHSQCCGKAICIVHSNLLWQVSANADVDGAWSSCMDGVGIAWWKACLHTCVTHLHETLSIVHGLSESSVFCGEPCRQSCLVSPKLGLVRRHTRAASDGNAAIALVQLDDTSCISSNGLEHQQAASLAR